MRGTIYMEGLTIEDFLRMVEVSMAEATGPLKREVELLRAELRKSGRKTVSHRSAAAYFDNAISPARILDYIKGRRLPEGVRGPLPAHKVGQQWYMRVDDIEKWQLGESG